VASKDTTVEFPDVEPQYVFERDCLAFPALARGKPVQCLVTVEFLTAYFGVREPSEASMRRAFHEHRGEIQEIARNHIESGWIDDQDRVFLTTRFTRLAVTSGPALLRAMDDTPSMRVILQPLHRLLVDIVGPNAGEVNVEWELLGSASARPSFSLSILDPSTKKRLSTLFSPEIYSDPAASRLLIASLWGTILKARSRMFVPG
jgi:Protein of unknown function (DUF1488)